MTEFLGNVPNVDLSLSLSPSCFSNLEESCAQSRPPNDSLVQNQIKSADDLFLNSFDLDSMNWFDLFLCTCCND